jgi:hypothetical protein
MEYTSSGVCAKYPVYTSYLGCSIKKGSVEKPRFISHSQISVEMTESSTKKDCLGSLLGKKLIGE